MSRTNTYSSLAFAERRAWAERHVKEGRLIVERQQELIVRRKAAQLDTTDSEHLLTQFEISQKIFEDDLSRVLSEKQR